MQLRARVERCTACTLSIQSSIDEGQSVVERCVTGAYSDPIRDRLGLAASVGRVYVARLSELAVRRVRSKIGQ